MELHARAIPKSWVAIQVFATQVIASFDLLSYFHMKNAAKTKATVKSKKVVITI